MPRRKRNRSSNWRRGPREVVELERLKTAVFNRSWELKRAVFNRSWEEVSSLLRDSSYSVSSVEEFVKACEWHGRVHVDHEIMFHCSSEQKDRLLETAVNVCRGDGDHVERWNDVKILLQDSNYSSSSVEKFIAACEQYEVIHVDGEILSHCSSEQRDRLLKTALKPCRGKGRWSVVKGLLQDCNYSSSSVEIFIAACEQYSVIHVDHEILSHCSSEQMDRLLKTALKSCSGKGRGWNGVKALLQDCNFSSSIVEMFIAACEQYKKIPVDGEILSHCSSQQKNRLLKTAVYLCGKNVNRWNEVKALLQDTNYSSSSVEQFVAACEQYDVIHVDGEILSHCSPEQRSRLFETAVKNESWMEVKVLLKDRGHSSSIVEQFITSCEQHGAICVNEDLLSHCTSEQHGRLLETGVREMMWEEVDGLLQYLHYSASFVEQFVTDCEKYGVVHYCPEVLSQCTTQQLDRLLTLATTLAKTLNQWYVVGGLLKAGGSHEKRVWTIEQAIEQACLIGLTTSDRFLDYILPNVNDDFLSHCSTEQMDSLLRALTMTKRWRIVGKAFKAGGNHENRVWVIEQAFLTGKRCDSDVGKYILPHVNDDFLSQCSSQQLDRLLTTFTTTRRWQLVDEVLKAGGSLEKRLWAIQKACETVEPWMDPLPPIHQSVPGYLQDTSFDDYILPHVKHDLLSHCNTQQLDRLLEAAARRRRWEYVDKVLKVGGSTEKRASVIGHACQKADHMDFQRYISPHCDDQMYKPQIVSNPESGFNVLSYAVLNEHCPRRMVAECIRLGFSTHQPPSILTRSGRIASAVSSYGLINWGDWRDCTVSNFITSPFLLAVLRGMPIVAHMLYESGSSSYSELMHLYTVLLDLSDPHTEEGRKLNEGEYLTDRERLHYFELYSERYRAFMNTLTTFLPYLREMASTPRSLVSTCRLVFSHCLTVGGGRERAVKQLLLPDIMKNFLLFSDLTDPEYKPRMYKTMSAALSQQE